MAVEEDVSGVGKEYAERNINQQFKELGQFTHEVVALIQPPVYRLHHAVRAKTKYDDDKLYRTHIDLYGDSIAQGFRDPPLPNDPDYLGVGVFPEPYPPARMFQEYMVSRGCDWTITDRSAGGTVSDHTIETLVSHPEDFDHSNITVVLATMSNNYGHYFLGDEEMLEEAIDLARGIGIGMRGESSMKVDFPDRFQRIGRAIRSVGRAITAPQTIRFLKKSNDYAPEVCEQYGRVLDTIYDVSSGFSNVDRLFIYGVPNFANFQGLTLLTAPKHLRDEALEVVDKFDIIVRLYAALISCTANNGVTAAITDFVQRHRGEKIPQFVYIDLYRRRRDEFRGEHLGLNALIGVAREMALRSLAPDGRSVLYLPRI